MPSAFTIGCVAADLIIELSGLVAAQRQRVYDAMTDPTQVAVWWGPEGFTCPEVKLDPLDGERFHLTGQYVEVAPPSRLAYTFQWDPPDPDDCVTTARIAFRELDGDTEVTLIQGPFATEARRELHRTGWAETLFRLATYLAAA
jgi:uncharacterized protein YndB with AHSA1/START domain